MAKRRGLRGAALQSSNAKRRREASAATPPVPIKTELEIVTEMLTDCTEKQKVCLEEFKTLLKVWQDRCSRLEYYESFIKNSNKRDENLEKLDERIKKSEAELTAIDKKEGMVLESIQSMEKQDRRLGEVHREVARYHGFVATSYRKNDRVRMKMPNEADVNSDLNSFPTLNELLVNIGVSARVGPPPALLEDDLEELQFPINETSRYYGFFTKEMELARQCSQRQEEIIRMGCQIEKSGYQNFQKNKKQILKYSQNPEMLIRVRSKQQVAIREAFTKWTGLVRKVHIKKASLATYKEEEQRLSALQDSRDEHLEKIREKVNQEQYNCEICLQLMTSGDSSERCPKVFGSCGHTACAQCMIQFKDPLAQKWRCPECRTQSTQLFTNWTVMRKINPAWQKKTGDVIWLD